MRIKILVYATLATLLILFVNKAAASSCSSGDSFSCPTCDGTVIIEVSDCIDCDGYMQTDRLNKQCFRRHLFNLGAHKDEIHHEYHYWWNDILGMFVWFITAGVAMACGVGGGGIYVPLGILLFQFAPKPASGLSQASIFGASLGGLLLNSRSVHPNEKIRHDKGNPVTNAEDASVSSGENTDVPRNRTTIQREFTAVEESAYEAAGGTFYTRALIDYDMALFLAPMEMAGAVLGVLVQKVLPNWLYLLFAGIVLGLTARKTFIKYFSTAAHESQPTSEALLEKDEKVYVDSNETETSSESPSSNFAPSETVLDDPHLEERKKFLEYDMRQYPPEKVGALVVLWIGLFALTLMKGGKGVESLVGISCRSGWYAVLIFCQFLWLFGFAASFGLKLVRDQEARVAVQYPYMPEDPVWNAHSLKFYGIITFVAGIVAGLIGIGGGMVLGPLMLLMGIHPRVSSATTATMIVVTSSSVAVMFVTSGLVPWTYAVFYFWVCFAGALVGKSRIDAYVKRTGKASFLILTLATIIALATLGCLAIMLMRLEDKDWCFDGFNRFCDVKEHQQHSCPAA